MMSFADAIRTCLSKYTTISGRAQRSEYWWFVLFNVVISAAINAVEIVLLQGATLGLLDLLFLLAMLLPSICAGGRRLHDRDMSAWWLLVGLVPMAGGLILLVLMLLKGTEGPNRFGPDPLAAPGAAATPLGA